MAIFFNAAAPCGRKDRNSQRYFTENLQSDIGGG
jgi:hypothetical protein